MQKIEYSRLVKYNYLLIFIKITPYLKNYIDFPGYFGLKH